MTRPMQQFLRKPQMDRVYNRMFALHTTQELVGSEVLF